MDSHLWLRLELRHLVALRAVAREGSFAAAAAALGYTPSAVSQQIGMLERIVGADVVARPGGRRPAVLTEVGRVLVDHAEAIVARLQAARADIATLVEGEAGTLRLGAYQSIGVRILPSLLRAFRKEWPSFGIRLHEAAGDRDLLERVEDGRLDLSFAILPASAGPFAGVELLRDPYVLVVPASSDLAERGKPVALKQLAGLPLISFNSCSQQPLIEAHLRASGVEPQIVFTSDDNGTVQSLVAAGIGHALVPRLTMDSEDGATALLELERGLPPRRIGLAWHRDRYQSPAATAFVAAARQAFASYGARLALSSAGR